MKSTRKDHRILLKRSTLADFPAVKLREGFALRWYKPGDEILWLRIQSQADRYNQISLELFQKHFANQGQPDQSLGLRQCYLLNPAGEAIGTGTAWYNDDFQSGRWGRVHWLAIVPEYQGQDLGKALLSAVCVRLHELGHDRAYLTTSPLRPAAIRLYLQFGFEPMIENEREEQVWRAVLDKIDSR